jgi:hypothetical protein
VKILVVAVLVAAGLWAWQHHRHAVLEHRLAAVASELAGRPVHVQCQGFFAELVDVYDRAGDVEFPGGHPADTTHLTRKTCRALDRFRSSSAHHELDCLRTFDWSGGPPGTRIESDCIRRAQSVTNAITTLTHEAMHLRGWTSEAQAQCYAIQEAAWTVVRLGGTAAEGAAVARLALAEQPGLPSEYQSTQCTAGGAFDVHPETPAFPAEAEPALLPADLVGPALVG